MSCSLYKISESEGAGSRGSSARENLRKVCRSQYQRTLKHIRPILRSFDWTIDFISDKPRLFASKLLPECGSIRKSLARVHLDLAENSPGPEIMKQAFLVGTMAPDGIIIFPYFSTDLAETALDVTQTIVRITS